MRILSFITLSSHVALLSLSISLSLSLSRALFFDALQ